MKRSSGPRRTTNLPDSLHQQLNLYALAAGAAGVSLLALAQPSEAKIVYTPANVTLSPQNGIVRHHLDLNHDGTTDFTLIDQWQMCARFGSTAGVGLIAPSGNGAEGVLVPTPFRALTASYSRQEPFQARWRLCSAWMHKAARQLLVAPPPRWALLRRFRS
jgi:hypothetical protein